MTDGLPQGWCDAAISDVGEVFLGKTPARTDYASSGNLKVVKFRDIQDGRVDFSNAKDGFVRNDRDALSGLRELHRGDVLITSAAHSGENIGKKCAYVSSLPEEFAQIFFTGELLNIRCPDDTVGRWAYVFFRSADGYSEIQEAVTGVHLTGGRAKQMRIPLAPLAEQRRIVAKLEKLLSKVDACQQRLVKIPILLKRFRQSLLAAACSGRLTADWRDENSLCLAPPAKPQNNGFDVNFLTEDLPDGWQVQRVDDAATIIDCLHKTPKYADSGYPMVRVTDVKGEYLDLSSARLVSEEVFREFTRRYTPRRGDIVFSRVGSFGNVSYVGSDMKFCLGQNTAIISPNSNSRFLHLSLQSPTVRDQMDAAVVGTSQPTISLKSISALAVPIPPLAEQQEIVRRVEALFALADQIEARYAKAKAHVEKLTPSLLARAFRGELVPQDPNDEPASALLERIKSQRPQDNESNRKTKRASLAAV
jgi:type I restriction enzyme, S subunit